MSRRAPLNDEMVRILIAARDKTLVLSDTRRWTIMGDAPPARQTREQLRSRGYLVHDGHEGLLTELGAKALVAADLCPNCEGLGHEHTMLGEFKVWHCPSMPPNECRVFAHTKDDTLVHTYARHPDTYWPAEHPEDRDG